MTRASRLLTRSSRSRKRQPRRCANAFPTPDFPAPMKPTRVMSMKTAYEKEEQTIAARESYCLLTRILPEKERSPTDEAPLFEVPANERPSVSWKVGC